MSSAFFYGAAAGLSLALGRASVWIWNRTPERWLCDYGECGIPGGHRTIACTFQWSVFLGTPFFILMLRADGCVSKFVPAAAGALALIQLAAGDARYRILPDQWILCLAAAGLMFPVPAAARAAGLLAPLAVYIPAALIARASGRLPGLGAGDAKLASAAGFAFGIPAMGIIFCRAFLAAGLWASLLLFTKKAARGDRIAFGPFAALSCYLYLLSLIR
ncbi:MAG: A24 family peptidase [Anaerovoracaceae bacterium]|jgi:prepilin signal peptidase PulO-like enzyme (type II secretory pathway)